MTTPPPPEPLASKGQTMATINAFYGSSRTPTCLYTYEDLHGTWYVCDGSINVNHTRDSVTDGVWIEELADDDTFTWASPIQSEEQLAVAVED